MLNEEAKRRGITEEQMMADLEKTREEVYKRHYGDSQMPDDSGEESSS